MRGRPLLRPWTLGEGAVAHLSSRRPRRGTDARRFEPSVGCRRLCCCRCCREEGGETQGMRARQRARIIRSEAWRCEWCSGVAVQASHVSTDALDRERPGGSSRRTLVLGSTAACARPAARDRGRARDWEHSRIASCRVVEERDEGAGRRARLTWAWRRGCMQRAL